MPGITPGYDVTHNDIGSLPPNPPMVALYSTEVGTTAGIKATAEDYAKYPNCLRICQDPAASDETADYLDRETGAATDSDLVRWSKNTLANFHNGVRPGQRSPCIYASQSELTDVANILTAGGLANGSIGFIVANWNLSEQTSDTEILDASGPFPIHGIQFKSAAAYDFDVWSTDWLNNRSKGKTPAPAPLPVGNPGLYVVEVGDSLSSIAAKLGITDWQSIYTLNGAVIGDDPNRIFPGQVLVLPAGKATGGHIYIVQPGDNLTEIADRFGLPSWQYIYERNRAVIGSDPNEIHPGQRLIV